MFGEQVGIKMMTMWCLQKQIYFISPFGCFRTALMVATFAGDMNAIQLLLWHGADSLIKITLASWLWITLACLDMLGNWFTLLLEGLSCQCLR